MGETGKRIISGLIFASFYVLSFNVEILFHNFLVYFFLFIAIIIGMNEFYTMASKSEELKPHRKTGIAFGLIVVTLVLIYTLQQAAQKDVNLFSPGFVEFINKIHLNGNTIVGGLISFIFIIFLIQIVSGKIKGGVYSISSTLLGVFYVSICGSHLLLLKDLDHGVFFIWLVSFATIMSDTTAYFAGKTMGRHKVGFAISPNKSWEGYIGGLIFQVILTVAFYYGIKQWFTVPPMGAIEITLFAVVIYLVSVLGDLSESLIKRDCEVKDSGSFIPGHGGLLDVIDALILTIPGSYYFLIFLEYVKSP